MSEFEDLEDDELVAATLKGERQAFETLYSRYLKRIYNLVYRMVGPQEAEEVTQEAFLQAYRNLAKFRGDAQLYTWLYRVASNTALQHLRKKGRREGRQTSFEDLLENAPGALPEASLSVFDDPQKAAESSELQRHVREVLGTLPPNQRMVLLLGPIQGMSYEEMAKALDASVPIVKARLHRARENLRERVAARYHGDQPPPDPDTSLLVKQPKPETDGRKKRRKKKASEPTQERGPPGEVPPASAPPGEPGRDAKDA